MLGDFVNVAKECKDLSFRQVWEIYDKQFADIKKEIDALGDKFVVEEFTGIHSDVLNLENSYTTNHTIVYLNNVIQWKDLDYYETDPKTITLVKVPKDSDTIRVVIVLTSILSTENIYNRVDTLVRDVVIDYINDFMSNPNNPDNVDNKIKDYINTYLSDPKNWPDKILILDKDGTPQS